MSVATDMASIFISYRREDASGHAGRLLDRLTAGFGASCVFMDIQDIHPGQNFATSIEDTIATCDCVIAVIGPHWLESVRKRAQSDDFVRHEIGAGLQRHLTVIPVLVGGARMPAAGDLPPDLAELSFLNAIEIRDERFDRDVVDLENFLAGQLRVGSTPAAGARAFGRRHAIAAIVVIGIAVATAAYFVPRRSRSSTSPGAVARNSSVAVTPNVAGDWVAEMQNAAQHRFRLRLRF